MNDDHRHAEPGEQDVFEERIFNQYFPSTIQRNPDKRPRIAGCLDFVALDCKTKDEFLARKPDGTYVDPTINAAWWAWQAALKEHLVNQS